VIELKMAKDMNIIKDCKQVRVAIPKKYVEQFEITSKDKIRWWIYCGKLNASLRKTPKN